MGGKMSLQKKLFVNLLILMVIFVFFELGFTQVKKGETVSFTGVIEKVDKDFKFIMVNEAKIILSDAIKIFDEKRNPLKISDLKPNLTVTIHAVGNPGGFLANKIVVKTTKR